MIRIRFEKSGDRPSIRALNEEAFGQSAEADLVDELRRACQSAISIVAVEDEIVVGHIMFSPVTITDGERILEGMGLGPMAVRPNRQRQGIGSRLVTRGLEIIKDRGYPFVIVLGHPEYYPRFGFVPASLFDVKCQWDGIPDNAFMIFVLDQDMAGNIRGVARYREEFDDTL